MFVSCYRKHGLPDGTSLKNPIILSGVRVAGLKSGQSKQKGSKDPHSGLNLPWKRRTPLPRPHKREDWEI